jgi:uncharacterized protein (TIGR02246 family)
MKKLIISATLTAVAALLVLAQTGKDARVEEEIRRLNAQEVEALLRNDVATLKRLWSDDFVVTNPFNKFITKQQVAGMTESGTLAFTAYDRKVEYVRVFGDTAVVAGSETVVWAGKMPTAGQTSHLRFTGVWMKQGGRWQQVARHANMVVQQ